MLTVNLTTTYQRLSLCRIALTSLLLQSKLPDQINLWVSKEAYLSDQGISDTNAINQLIESLPKSNRNLVKVRWVSNIGPYRKLIPALREAKPDDVMIPADDDIFYGLDWVNNLLKAYTTGNGKVVAGRVRITKTNSFGKKTSYHYWKKCKKYSVVDDNFIITFGGGAVLTRRMFRDQDIADDSFLSLAPTADDLWYSKLLRLNNCSVIVVPSILNELNFIEHDDGLIKYNLPRTKSFISKCSLRFRGRFLGFLGLPLCGNDIAYAQINNYFDKYRNR